MITDIFRKQFAALVEGFEGRELKLYIDTRGVPTIGIGFALINYDTLNREWTVYNEKVLRDEGINITTAQYKIITDYAAAKSEGESTASLKEQIKAFDLTITNEVADHLVQYIIDTKYQENIIDAKSIGEQVWDNLSLARQMAIMDHAYHSGNIAPLKAGLIAGDFKQVADTIRARPGEDGLKARYTLRAKMIEEDQSSFKDVYIVKKGDNAFSNIANKYGMSVPELAKLNPQIKDVGKMFMGQMINVPEDFFKEHYQELNTIIRGNAEFTRIFNEYKASLPSEPNPNPTTGTNDEWIARLNTALFNNFTPSTLLPQVPLTPNILNPKNTNTINMFYMSIEDQRKGASMLKPLIDKGGTYDQLPAQMQEPLKFTDFITFNDLILFFNKTISAVQNNCNKLLEQISDKNSDNYAAAKKYVDDTITALTHKSEQLTANMANNFHYLKEILELNKDIETLYYNITSQEDAHINKIETLLRISTTDVTIEQHHEAEHHEEASHKAKRETDEQKIDNEKIKTDEQMSNNDIEAKTKSKDILIADANIPINWEDSGNAVLNHTPLLSYESTTDSVSTTNTSNIPNVGINSILILGNLLVRMINKGDNNTTDRKTTIHNDTVNSGDAHNLAYSGSKPAIDDNEDNVDLLG